MKIYIKTCQTLDHKKINTQFGM